MSPAQAVTETIMLRLKEGIDLENRTSGPAVQSFVQLTDTVRIQPGFIRQFWGHQVEDQRVFVWCIDWESFEHSTAFAGSEDYVSFVDGMGHVFDLEAAAPLTMYTRFTSDAVAAFAAPVTEVAFFTVPDGVREEAKTLIEKESIESHPVFTVGKSSGGAIGWVFDAKNADDAAPDGQSIALLGVFGYASVDDHIRWRQTPEHALVIEEMGRSELGDLGLGNAILPGGNIFVSDSSMFHVRFAQGYEKGSVV